MDHLFARFLKSRCQVLRLTLPQLDQFEAYCKTAQWLPDAASVALTSDPCPTTVLPLLTHHRSRHCLEQRVGT